MSYDPIKVYGSEKHNRALGREWRLAGERGVPRLALKTRSEAIEQALEEDQCPTPIHNVYTGDVETVYSKPVITVKPEPNTRRIAVEHERSERERYYLVTTQTTCVRCRPEKGNRYPECDADHPEMVREVWRFVRKGRWAPVRYWPTALAVDGVGFVALMNALKAAEQAKTSIFDSQTGRRIPYKSVVTALIIFKNKAAEIARKAEAKGQEFWDNMS